ncbi:hypothetical protein WEN_02285 [Mycoplasma wenyonii str. Massachusetts]|uniref:Uncharacterized protein n=1 Tax=Mycoplasma wenyonii (strain Massachusetts) TaxID=1197325 RepID=I6YLU3_MYCWM|nr:hypothetical protein [Mycoplasma wenyonii]AFN65244.1 hypothetical protein WEN_02285 [Mycoplasma wenyonii str. Massachusetts]
MAVSPIAVKVLLATLGLGVVSTGVAVPLSNRQSTNQTFSDSVEASSPAASSSLRETQPSLKPLDRETLETLTNKQELEGKSCYTFFSTVQYETEDDLTSLLLFCSKTDSLDGGEETYYFWDGKDLKKVIDLKSESRSGNVLVTLEGYETHKTIYVEYDDQITDHWDTIMLSDCSIKSQTGILSDTERVLSCAHGEESVAPENVFRLAKWNFS